MMPPYPSRVVKSEQIACFSGAESSPLIFKKLWQEEQACIQVEFRLPAKFTIKVKVGPGSARPLLTVATDATLLRFKVTFKERLISRQVRGRVATGPTRQARARGEARST